MARSVAWLKQFRRSLLRLSIRNVLLLQIVTLSVLVLSWTLWCIFASQHPLLGQYIDKNYLKQFLVVIPVSYIIFMLLCAYLFKQCDVEQEADLVFWVILLYEAILIYCGYLSGLFLMQVGIVATGLPIIGIMLAPIRIIVRAWGYGILALSLLAVTNGLGWLPYAPLYRGAPLADPQFLKFYLISSCFISWPIFLAVIGMSRFIFSEWRLREKQVRILSQRDALTGLYNRREASQYVEKLLAGRSGTPIAIILLDIDWFKSINDAHGHLVGDRALKTVADIISAEVREDDLLARFGGEEFVLVLADTSRAIALQIAERCRESLERCRFTSDRGMPISLTASFGVTVALSGDGFRLDDLLRAADRALYQAKMQGRNCVQYQMTRAPTLPNMTPLTAEQLAGKRP